AESFYVKSPQEMMQVFKDLPQAIHTAAEIGKRCAVDLRSSAYHLPMFPVPDNFTLSEYFEKVTRDGYQRRLVEWQRLSDQKRLRHSLWEYEQRLQMEIQMIKQMGFEGYFLIVWDFIKYAKEQGIPVGPGRGSAAGSVVAFCLEITDIDPLQYDLLFERFLNPGRVTMPDIDIDFCVRGRGDVINHVANLSGRDSVCQIITFGTLASKAAIKDVGRALDMPFAEVDRISKLIPPPVRGRNVSISQALEQVPELKRETETNPQVKEL